MNKRIIELDGIRGLAILMVLCFHIFRRANYLTSNSLLHALDALTGMGWAGVDLFFVLSGFLITSILLKTKGKSHYFRNFYARRILRIFPLYYLTIAIVLPFLPTLDHLRGVQTQAMWPYFLLYQQNWIYIPKPVLSDFLGITWSLAIEEQFYFIWPSIVKWLKKRQLAFACIGIIFFSLITRLILTFVARGVFDLQRFFYYGTITRFDGLAVGSLIAIAFESEVWKSKFSRFARPVLGIALAGLLATVINQSVSPVSTNFLLSTWGYTFLAIIAGSMIVLVATQPEQTLIRIVFRNKPMVFFGKYSYAMYLLHMPITLILWNTMTRAGRNSGRAWLTFIIITFASTIVLSLLSWNLLEKHALNLKRFFQ